MSCLPSKSTVLFYGALTETGPTEIDPVLFIGRGLKLEGFVLGLYMKNHGMRFAINTNLKALKLNS